MPTPTLATSCPPAFFEGAGALQRAFAFLLLGLSLSCAFAHGVAKPRHGGVVDVGGETTFELVRSGTKVTVYVDDHGKPVDTTGASGEILRGSETGTRVAVLKAAGANTLAGQAVLRPGDRLFIRLVRGNGSSDVGEIRLP
jgi:hypothetical protein